MAHPARKEKASLPRTSLKERFAKAARRMTAPLLFAGIFAANSNDATAQTVPVQIPPQNNIEFPVTATLSLEEREKINLMLTEKAQSHFPAIMRLAHNARSDMLDSLSVELNRKLTAAHPDYPPIFVVDPMYYNVGRALGFDDRSILGALLSQKNIKVEDEMLDYAMKDAYVRYVSPYNDTLITFAPRVMRSESLQKDGFPILMIPPVEYVASNSFVDLPVAVASEFSMHHEAAHTLEFYYRYDGVNFDVAATFNPYDAESVNNNIDGLRMYTQRHKRECFADIAALGVMLRGGHGMDLVDAVANSRTDGASVAYLNHDAIMGFKSEIEKMGLEKFRKMPEEKLFDFYYNTTEKYTVDMKGMKSALLYLQDPQKFLTDSANESFAKDKELQKIFSIARQVFAPQKTEASGRALVNPETKEVLDNYNIDGEWIKFTHQKYGIVVPHTMILAYAEIMEKLDKNARTKPDRTDICTQKMVRLTAHMIENLMHYDYVQINEFYGMSPQQLAATKITLPAEAPPQLPKTISPAKP